MRKPLIYTHCHLICCVYIKGHVPICVNVHCLMLEVLRYIALNALNTVQKIKVMSKMSKIDKVHIRGVRLCMSKMSTMGKEYTHTFWLITSLILNGFSIRKSFGKLRLRAFQPYHQTLCILKHVEDVKDYLRRLSPTCHIPGTLFGLQCRL